MAHCFLQKLLLYEGRTVSNRNYCSTRGALFPTETIAPRGAHCFLQKLLLYEGRTVSIRNYCSTRGSLFPTEAIALRGVHCFLQKLLLYEGRTVANRNCCCMRGALLPIGTIRPQPLMAMFALLELAGEGVLRGGVYGGGEQSRLRKPLYPPQYTGG